MDVKCGARFVRILAFMNGQVFPSSAQVWDPRTEDPVLSLEPVEGETPADCWTVAFGNSYNDAERCIAAGPFVVHLSVANSLCFKNDLGYEATVFSYLSSWV